MQVPVLDINGKQIKTIELPADIFEAKINVGLMHQAYVRQMANARLGLHSTKTRAENNRTKAKWYRQKGTGRARHGSKSAPIFVGGGIAHGPKPRKYTKELPRQMRRAAIRSVLSALLRDQQLVVVDQFSVSSPKTKEMQQTLYNLVGEHSALVVLANKNENAERGISNLPNARYLRVNYLNMRDLLQYDKVILPLDAIEVIQNLWGKER
ncbi:MAG: 50S ribosomal protein L4 [Anaerolineae bacterium]|jgi:large subunit ribosomal protein L4|nr:50S ribosomal protein L4 [Anaerolineae bacterium]